MLFAIIGQDADDSQDKRPIYREEHLKRLDELDSKGKVILAGPFTDKSGSLIVIEANSLEEARAFAQGDPYVQQGVFKSFEVKPFKQVYPKG